jgi:hypothetical protein
MLKTSQIGSIAYKKYLVILRSKIFSFNFDKSKNEDVYKRCVGYAYSEKMLEVSIDMQTNLSFKKTGKHFTFVVDSVPECLEPTDELME